MNHPAAGDDLDPGRRVVVVGASIAGTRCAQGLRAAGFEGPITLIGAERHAPYDRPPLSKALLSRDWSPDAVVSAGLTGPDELAELAVDVRLGVPADRLDTVRRTVALADGSTVPYDVLVVATGASARPSPWQPPSGVHVLRTLDDSQTISDRFALQQPVVVVGGGFIGTEVAAAARLRGCAVTVVDPLPAPMSRLVGREIAEALVELHHRHGTATRFGSGVVAIEGEAGALKVVLDDGAVLPASTVVVGIGSIPATGWLAHSGIGTDGGVRCDEYLRARGAVGVFAAGDVARFPHPGLLHDVRSEHWTNAVDQARYVADAITHGSRQAFQPSDYVWSDQYDWKVQSIGWQDPLGASVLVGDLEEDGRAAVVHGGADGVLCGAVAVNWPRALLHSRRLLAQRELVSSVVEELRPPVG